MDARPIRTEFSYPTAFSGWDHQEIEAINRVVASNKFTMSDEVFAFEHEIAAYHGVRHAIAVNSGSSANLISVAAMAEHGLERGQKVLVPALAWATTYAPLIQYGLEPVLLDVDATWNAARNADLAHSFKLGNDDRVGLIVTCGILGNPEYAEFWAQLAANIGAMLLNDNCESIGARYPDGTLTGTNALASTLSCYWSHQLSAIEGGVILTNDGDFADTCRLLRNHGWSRGIYPTTCLEDEFMFLTHGFNLRPLELHAAIARVQLRKLDDRITARRVNLAYFSSETSRLPIVLPSWRGDPSPFGLHFEVDGKEVREKLACAFRANGIDCRPPVAGSFRKQPYGARWADQKTPQADLIHDQGIMIGNPPFDGFSLIDSAVKVMRETL